MLWSMVISVILWVLGMATANTMGGLIHILLVVAVIVVIVRLIQGRRVLFQATLPLLQGHAPSPRSGPPLRPFLSRFHACPRAQLGLEHFMGSKSDGSRWWPRSRSQAVVPPSTATKSENARGLLGHERRRPQLRVPVYGSFLERHADQNYRQTAAECDTCISNSSCASATFNCGAQCSYDSVGIGRESCSLLGNGTKPELSAHPVSRNRTKPSPPKLLSTASGLMVRWSTSPSLPKVLSSETVVCADSPEYSLRNRRPSRSTALRSALHCGARRRWSGSGRVEY